VDGKEKSKYRQTKKWKDFRKRILKERDYTCEICDTRKKKGMHIHHYDESTYGNETSEDVLVSCSTCHKLIEWLLSRTKNKVDIDVFCNNLKKAYEKSKKIF
jgi:5-methylcytosine-specific restriction endonuclease McrA